MTAKKRPLTERQQLIANLAKRIEKKRARLAQLKIDHRETERVFEKKIHFDLIQLAALRGKK